MNNAVAGGIAIGVVGKAVSSLGLVLQKKSHQQNFEGKHFCTDVRWAIAFGTYFLGNIIVIVALVLAPQVIIAALDCLVMVFNAGLAPQLLENEKLTKFDILASLVIIAGVGIVVYYGPSGDKDYSSSELTDLLKQREFIVFASASLALIVVLAVVLRYLEGKRGKRFLINDATLAGSAAAVAAGTIPAVLSSYNLQLSKICGELISTTIKGTNQFCSWEVYMFIGLLVICNTVQVAALQRALADYDALLIIPVFQVQLTIFAIINGGIYFKEFQEWTAIEPPLFFSGGVLLCILGVGVLSSRNWSTAPLLEDDGDHDGVVLNPGQQELSFVRSISFGLLDPTASSSTAILAADCKHLTPRDHDVKDVNDRGAGTMGEPLPLRKRVSFSDAPDDVMLIEPVAELLKSGMCAAEPIEQDTANSMLAKLFAQSDGVPCGAAYDYSFAQGPVSSSSSWSATTHTDGNEAIKWLSSVVAS